MEDRTGECSSRERVSVVWKRHGRKANDKKLKGKKKASDEGRVKKMYSRKMEKRDRDGGEGEEEEQTKGCKVRKDRKEGRKIRKIMYVNNCVEQQQIKNEGKNLNP